MLKTLLAATASLALLSGAGFAQTSYSDSTTKTTTGVATPLGDVDVTKTIHRSSNDDGMVTEKDKTITRNDPMIGEREKTVTRQTDVSPAGDVTEHKSETTTVR